MIDSGSGVQSAVERAASAHRDRWGSAAEFVARAPGRVNLIGEHTDYNDGFVFPMAIPADTAVAVSRAPGGDPTELVSEGFGRVELAATEVFDANPIDVTHWAAHVQGVRLLLAKHGVTVPAWRATVATDIPIGASLSSSAALEVAVTMALLELSGTRWSALDVAKLGQRVENDVLGLPSGIMDQLVSAVAVAGHASLIDCRSLDVRPVALPDGAAVAIMDTGTRRKLTESAFADRRETCVRAAKTLGVKSLRDASTGDLDRLAGDDLVIERRRARHVITENARTVEAAAAMVASDAVALGSLMTDSHRSLRDDYEVSGPALDRIVEVARSAPGCLGARMTGGGFAGCAVALVERDRTDEFLASTMTSSEAKIWFCEPGPGAALV
ncbi:MAG: galactokinase [Acidimicrobiales bacterium]